MGKNNTQIGNKKKDREKTANWIPPKNGNSRHRLVLFVVAFVNCHGTQQVKKKSNIIPLRVRVSRSFGEMERKRVQRERERME